MRAVLNCRDNYDHNHEAENEDNRKYDEHDIEEVWASDPIPSDHTEVKWQLRITPWKEAVV